MTQPDKNKNIFQAAIDAVSNRDEKAAIEAAMKQSEALEQRAVQAEQKAAQTAQKLAETEQRATQNAQKLAESERKVTQLTADLGKAQTELTTTRSALSAARNSLVATEQKLTTTNAELQKLVSAQQVAKTAETAAATAAAQVMAEHTVKADETLSHLAQKYYGSAGEAYWRLIYEANKAVIGDNPGRIRPGMALKIPVLPEEMKRK